MDFERIVREPERKKVTGYGATQWRELERKGEAPRRRQIGPRAVGWLLSELIGWVKSRPAVPGGRFSEPATEAAFSHATTTEDESSAPIEEIAQNCGSLDPPQRESPLRTKGEA